MFKPANDVSYITSHLAVAAIKSTWT